jgi:uncharacterized membrane protein
VRKVQVRTMVQRPVSDVFAYASRVETMPEWRGDVAEAAQLTDGPLGVGTRIRAGGRFLGRLVGIVVEVTEFEPGVRFGYRPVSGPLRTHNIYTFDGDAAGTQVTLSDEIELAGILGLLEPVMARVVGRQYEANLGRLKAILETKPGRTGEPVGTESFEMTVQIDRPSAEVFSFLADLANDPRWRREWVDAKRTSEGPIGVGTTTSLFASILGRRTEAVYEVTAFEPNRAVTWRTVRGPLPLTFWRRVEAAGQGTRVTMGYAGDFRGLLRLLRPLLVPMGKRALKGDLPAIKQLLESGTS